MSRVSLKKKSLYFFFISNAEMAPLKKKHDVLFYDKNVVLK